MAQCPTLNNPETFPLLTVLLNVHPPVFLNVAALWVLAARLLTATPLQLFSKPSLTRSSTTPLHRGPANTY